MHAKTFSKCNSKLIPGIVATVSLDCRTVSHSVCVQVGVSHYSGRSLNSVVGQSYYQYLSSHLML